MGIFPGILNQFLFRQGRQNSMQISESRESQETLDGSESNKELQFAAHFGNFEDGKYHFHSTEYLVPKNEYQEASSIEHLRQILDYAPVKVILQDFPHG